MEWRPGSVVAAEKYYMIIRSIPIQKTDIAYKYLRIKPTFSLPDDLSQGTVTAFLDSQTFSELEGFLTLMVSDEQSTTLMEFLSQVSGDEACLPANVSSPNSCDL